MKTKIILVASILLFAKTMSGQTTTTLWPGPDAYITTFGGGEGKNTFMKIPIYGIPSNSMSINAVLQVAVKEVGINWDGDVMFIRYLNQSWTESDSTQNMWNNLFWGDTLIQTTPLFGDTLGNTHSMDLSDLFNQDLFAGHSFFTFRMKDPDDPTMFPMLNIPVTNSYDSLMIGNIFDDYIIFYATSGYVPAIFRSKFDVTYVILPNVDTISGYGVFCENDNMTLLSDISGDGPFTFQWQKDNVDISGETDSTLTLNSLQISDAGWYSLIVNSPWATDTSDAVQCIVNTCSGNNLIEVSDQMKIFPNPAKIKIEIQTIENNYHVELTNIFGQIFFNGINTREINVSGYSPGTYILKINGKNLTVQKKVIVY